MLPRSYSLFIWNKAMMPILDFLTILVFYWLTYQFRYVWQAESDFFNSTQVTSLKNFTIFAILFSLCCVFYFALAGVYKIKNKTSFLRETLILALGVLIVMGWCIVYFFFSEYDNNFFPINGLRNIKLSRFLASFGVFTVIFGLYFQRLFIYIIKILLNHNGYFINHVAIVGQHPQHVIDSLQNKPQIRVKYVYNPENLDLYKDLTKKIQSNEIQEIYINSDTLNLNDILVMCERYKVITKVYDANLANLSEFTFEPKVLLDSIYMELKYSALDGWGVVCKRVFDIIFSLCFIFIFSPVYLLTAIVIILEDKGNPIYKSERVGPNGKNFFVYKFRRLKIKDCTTNDNLEALKKEADLIQNNDMRKDGVLYKIKNDPRTTKVGRFIEKTSIDELPQFFNVLRGNMSVVGPRPHQPREVAKYEQHHFKVLNIKPGITGLAQINGRSDLSFNSEVIYDTEYVRNWSFILDLKIIVLTPFKLLGGHKN
jgi:exopolysaccharide biosynthesis polyprenyl glycosylphosphotransferase